MTIVKVRNVMLCSVDNDDLFNSHVDFGLHSTTYTHMKEQRVRLENFYGVSGTALS